MINLQETILAMQEDGMTDAEIVRALKHVRWSSARPVEPTLEKRRAYDRERKAKKRADLEMSGGIPVEVTEKEKSPHTPLKENNPPDISPTGNIIPPKPEKRTPRTGLLSVLDDEHAAAVIEHRQRIKRPLTAHAAKLLANKFAKCADPNAAADAMIVAGWQGFEPKWMENMAQGRAPPNRNGKTQWGREMNAFEKILGEIDGPEESENQGANVVVYDAGTRARGQ